MRRWVIGCTHFDDSNIVQYRPAFSSLDDMNESLAGSWESRVAPDDLVYVLGDFALSRPRYWVQRLPGHKILVMGNHDKASSLYAGFEDVQQWMLLRVPTCAPGNRPALVFLCHYPLVSWPEKSLGAIHLHAHSHGQGLSRAQNGPGPQRVDMSVECWESWPVPVDSIIEQRRSEQ